jgi:hypothetical protein
VAIKIMVLTAFYSGAATTPMTLRQTIPTALVSA